MDDNSRRSDPPSVRDIRHIERETKLDPANAIRLYYRNHADRDAAIRRFIEDRERTPGSDRQIATDRDR